MHASTLFQYQFGDASHDEIAAYLVEYQVLVLDDPNYVAETGRAVYGWWGLCCVECLVWVQETPELIWPDQATTRYPSLSADRDPACPD